MVTAGEEGIAVICPDTSPRGAGVEGEEGEDDLGTGRYIPRPEKARGKLTCWQGAGFYLNATTEKWKKHYNMYDLIVHEIPGVLKEANLGLVSFVGSGQRENKAEARRSAGFR